ncbi:hypothetical protein B0H15DRAFT_946850 [Mycena belliarum]|uniref:Uncharacterized protein n=1 Tax=Mycena belliarum TaxID=1033014 RepID=A0AAD6XRI7_9AGAR|nr:hypothetical protein B0H15DRAFT_946850 [Mycena belliae]
MDGSAPTTSPSAATPVDAPISLPSAAASVEGKKEQSKKHGNKGDFHGQRLQYLESMVKEYLAHSKSGTTRRFWPKMLAGYWERFDWRLAIDEEPTGPAPSELGVLMESDQTAKEKAMKLMTAKLKSWYNHRRTALGMEYNPFTNWLARLRRPVDKMPKRIADYQFYMQHADYKAAVNATFEDRHWDAPRSERLSLRCAIAREKFEAEPQAVKDRMRHEAMEELQEELARWKDAEEGLPSLEESDRVESRRRFSAVVTPLLQALRAYTGYHVTLLAGRLVPGDDPDLVSVHAGKTGREGDPEAVDLTEWDVVGYKERVLEHFVRFLVAAEAAEGPKTGGAGMAPAMASSSAGGYSATDAASAATLQTAPMSTMSVAVPMDVQMAASPPDVQGSMATTTAAANDLRNDEELRPARLRDSGSGPTASMQARLDALGGSVGPALRLEIGDLSPPEAATRVVELEKMDGVELQRTNNIAMSSAALRALDSSKRGGLNDADRELLFGRSVATNEARPTKEGNAKAAVDGSGGTSGAAGSKKRGRGKGKAVKRRPHKRRRGAASGSDEDTDDISNSEDEEGNGGAEPPTTRAGRRAQAEADGESRDLAGGLRPDHCKKGEAPEWAEDALASLAALEHGGEAWKSLCDAWWKVEAAAGFQGTKRLPAKGRPAEVGWWIGRARARAPTISNADKFGSTLKQWWSSVNPAWRRGGGNMLKRQEGESWDALQVPGVNGMLGILVCLKWWRDALGSEGPLEEWDLLVDDVAWALGQILGADGAVSGPDAIGGGLELGV